MKHPMQDNILTNANYKEQAKWALDLIFLSYRTRFVALRTAYEDHFISSYQLNDARRLLMQEASGILATHPADTPQGVLLSLKRNARIQFLKAESFSALEYIEEITGS
ncbi:MAG: hypothetical protein E6Q36_00105 [Chryseobacterium sp.]|nr:MAG: hypothetical protein E6Q36_00105 [Chryseobacterium sp.]